MSGEKVFITVSTRLVPRTLARKPGHADGFIVCVDKRGARVVAEGLGFTNECKVDPSGKWLYVNETFGKRLSRFPLHEDGDLGKRETVATFGAGVFPDGLDFDAEGGVWITSVFSNRLIRVMPDGSQTPGARRQRPRIRRRGSRPISRAARLRRPAIPRCRRS